MGQMKNQSFWKAPSRFCQEGLYQYVFWRMGSGELSAPSDPLMHVVFVQDGVANYGDIIARVGDVLACGVNRRPMSSQCEGLTLFTIDMDFFLFYRLTGIVPSLLGQRSAEFLPGSNPFYQLGQRLFELPINCWVDKIEEQIERWLGQRTYYAGAQLERVASTAQVLFHNWNADLDRLSSQFSISYRQIQRDFLAVLGVTPKEYASMLRFSSAIQALAGSNLSEVALHAGYWDQSHMSRDFKRMAGITPAQLSQNGMFDNISKVRAGWQKSIRENYCGDQIQEWLIREHIRKIAGA